MCRLNAVAISLSLLLFAASASAQIYRWVDDNGRVQFSDKPHSQQAEVVKLRSSASGWKPLNIEVIQQGSLQGGSARLDEAKVQRDVNLVYRFYDEVIYFDFYRQVPVKIHLLPNRAEYIAFVRKAMGADGSQSLGLYVPSLHEIAVYIHEDEIGGLESTYATIRHEASHAILHSLAERMPLWLNEGMAEQMETLVATDGELAILPHRNNRAVCLQRRQRVGDVLAFVEIKSDRWQKANLAEGTNQSMAGQLVYFLLSRSYGRSLITRLLQDYKRGVNVRSYYLLDEHYVGGRQTLNIHWRQWLSEDMRSPVEIRF
jgi:hypothetical protein